jgi:outer membrane protein assembly factor BamB
MTSSGTLYAITNLNYLYTINSSTGAATLVHTVKDASNNNISEIRGLASDSSGVLYVQTTAGSLYTVNTTTGTATLVVNFDTALGQNVSTDDIVYYDGAIYALTNTGMI